MLLRAQFVRFYGADLYYAPARWPTRDGVIPWSLLFAYHTAMWRVMALERLQDARAIAHGIALAFDGQKPEVQRITQAEIAEASGG